MTFADRRKACRSSLWLTWILAPLAAVWSAEGGNLTTALEQVAQRIGGRVGLSAVLVESGEHVAFHGDQAFFMASVVKFPVALRVLQLVDEGKLHWDEKATVQRTEVVLGSTVLGAASKAGDYTVRDLLNNMISWSDNTSCDALMRLGGGPKAVLGRLQALGIAGIRVDRTEKELETAFQRSHAAFLKDVRDTSTPDAMAALLAKFQAGEALKPATATVLRGMMEAATPNRLKALLPSGTAVAHKTGTWRNAATNDVGIITLPGGSRHIAVAIFTNRSKKDLPAVEQAIAEMARAVYDHWAAPETR